MHLIRGCPLTLFLDNSNLFLNIVAFNTESRGSAASDTLGQLEKQGTGICTKSCMSRDNSELIVLFTNTTRDD